jgi:hypothetical protein
MVSAHRDTGDQILLREVWRGRVWSAMPVTVVEDRPGLIASSSPRSGFSW